MDEAEFIKRTTLESGPFSFLAQNAIIICVSTPGYRDTPMNTVRIAKLNGKYVCTFLDFDYTCQDCKAATKTNPEIICKCRDHMRPLIHNDYALQVSKLLFSNKEAYAKEMLGTVHDNVRPLIDPEDIKVMTETVFDGDYDISEPKYVMVTCDPCGASVQKKNDNTSDYAIVTTFLSGTKIWVRKYIYCCC